MPALLPRMLGDANKYAILNLLKESGSISRADLARALGMSPPAISSNIAVLLETGIIAEVGSGSAEYGRKPILLEYNPAFRYALGIDIGEIATKLAVADCRGVVVGSREILTNPVLGARPILANAVGEMRLLLDETDVPMEKVGAIAISVPGIVDGATGELTLSTVIDKWEGVRIGEMLESEFSVPAIVGNDVDMAIMGEFSAGIGQGHDNLIYIKIGDGLAARIVLGGKLFHGAHNSAGEIGYMLLDGEETQARFHSRGALEQRICNDTIDREYRAARSKAGMPRLPEASMTTLARLISLAEGGDVIAEKILERVMDRLSRMLVNMTSVLDVDLVILGGDGESLGETQLKAIKDFMARHVPYVPSVVASNLRGMAGIAGCVHCGVELLEERMSSLW